MKIANPDMVLSIFDQSRRDENDFRVLKFDDNAYNDDADMTPSMPFGNLTQI